MVESVGRVFVAVPVPGEVRAMLAAHVATLDIPGRLAAAENWHITVRFLGTLNEITYDRFLGEMSEAEFPQAFSIRLGSIGCFPSTRKATVVWVGVDQGDQEMASINEIAEAAAQTVGLKPEDRPCHPHLTLSRVRPPRGVAQLVEEDVDLRWLAEEVIVYQSVPTRGGVAYEPLEVFRL